MPVDLSQIYMGYWQVALTFSKLIAPVFLLEI